MKPPGLREIAARAGLSLATVSLALRGSREVSAATRRRVRALAREMGWQPNPLLSAWQAHVRRRRPTEYHATLGWINDTPDPDSWFRHPFLIPLREGAAQRAAQLGYRLDDVWLPNVRVETPRENIAAFSRVLRARGIHGVILARPWCSQHASLEWPDCAVVVVGETQEPERLLPRGARRPRFHHRVNPDYYHNAATAFRALRRAGYRRIGLSISRYAERVTEGRLTAAVLREQLALSENERVRPLVHPDDQFDTALDRWLSEQRPDAIICWHNAYRSALESRGLRVPEDIGLAHLDLEPDVAGWSGIQTFPAEISAVAVDLLHSLLQHNELSAPRHPREILVPGEWRDGETARPAGRERGP